MKAVVVKDATLTIKAGQTVEIDEKQFAIARKLGLVTAAKETETKAKKGAAK